MCVFIFVWKCVCLPKATAALESVVNGIMGHDEKSQC